MAPTATVSKPLPSTLSNSQAIAALHNHNLMIKAICPQLISYELESRTGNSGTYKVTDKKPIGQTTYTLTLTNQPNGIDSLVNAKPPVGTLTIIGKWRVEGGKLIEEADIEGNMVTKKMAKGNVEKQHPEAMDLIFQEALKA